VGGVAWRGLALRVALAGVVGSSAAALPRARRCVSVGGCAGHVYRGRRAGCAPSPAAFFRAGSVAGALSAAVALTRRSRGALRDKAAQRP